MQRTTSFFIFLFLSIVTASQATLQAAQRDWLMSLPLVSMGRESLLGLEFNMMNEFSLGIHWGVLSEGEELRKNELEKHPDDSFVTSGQDIGLIFQRFSNPSEMSGFHWGLSAGYRRVVGVWTKDPYSDGQVSRSGMDENGKIRQYLEMSGTSLGFRTGYRFVADSPGFMVGIYLKLRHFQNQVKDQESKKDEPFRVAISKEDSGALKRRLMSSMLAGIEVGWAF